MQRLTKRAAIAQVAERKTAQGGAFVCTLMAAAVGKASDPRWSLVIGLTDGDAVREEFAVADDSGKVKLFGTLDQVVKFAAEVVESPNGDYQLPSIETGALYASKVPADIYADAERKVVKLTKVMGVQLAKRTALQNLLSEGGPMFGWDSGNAAQRARFEEVEAEISAVNGDYNAISDEIAAQQAVVDSKP